MSHGNPLILQVYVPGAQPYQIGDDIWQQPLSDAIRAEAETIADHAGPGTPPAAWPEPAEPRSATTSSSK